MTEPTDYNEAGEIFRKSMEDSLAHLDKVAAEATKAHEKAIDMQIAAKDEFNRIEREAHQISEAYIEKHRKEYEARIRNETLFKVAKTLILEGRTSVEVIKWLDISDKMISDAWFDLGFSKLGSHIAHVAYETQGHAGYVFFYREDVMLRFPFEFGAGLVLAVIDIPTEERWTQETKLPLEDRMPILEFVAQRVLRDQAAGHKSVIKNDSIIITL